MGLARPAVLLTRTGLKSDGRTRRNDTYRFPAGYRGRPRKTPVTAAGTSGRVTRGVVVPKKHVELRKLADDIGELLTGTNDIAKDKKPSPADRWQGPTATRIRGELRVHTAKLRVSAASLEKESAAMALKDIDKQGA